MAGTDRRPARSVHGDLCRNCAFSASSGYIGLMGWFSRERKFTAGELEAAVQQAVARVLQERRSSETQALSETLEKLIGKQFESFAQNAGAMTGFLGALGELAIKRAAVALGSRGGRKRAENAEAKKAPRVAHTDCPVCVNPMSTDQAAIIRHVTQGHERRAANQPDGNAAAEHTKFVNSSARNGNSALN